MQRYRPGTGRSHQGRAVGRYRTCEAERPAGVPRPQTQLHPRTVHDDRQTAGIAQIAKETGLTRQTIYRIKDDPAGAEAALAAWGL
jgi:hypothetical protein